MCESQLVYKFRVKDKHAAALNRQAIAVNTVWNYCNETQQHAAACRRRWPSAYDLQKLTAGAAKDLGLHAHTVQRVCSEYDKCMRKSNRPRLRWRVSYGSKHSLGWVPFNTGHAKFDGAAFVFNGDKYSVWLSRSMPTGIKIGAGSFNQDAKGNWYINCPVSVPANASPGTATIGIDLGLKSFATMSDGETIEAERFYRNLEPALAVAQRAGKAGRVKAIHAKVVNRRKDFLHKLSTRLVQENAAIFVGNVNSSSLMKTTMAKSVSDAGWSSFRTMLAYKAIRSRVMFAEVNEAFSTRACSGCGSIAGPRGHAGLNERIWSCRDCGTIHDRDVNSAKNILARGLASLAEGAPI